MAVREYVGARYVPIYDGDWDINKVYEPLTIVDVANVGSYTSKKYVPAGTAITDTDYWAMSGQLNGQIISLTNRVDALEVKTDRNILMIGNSYLNGGVADKLAACFQNNYKFWDDGAALIDYVSHPVDFEDLLDTAIADTSIDKDSITDVIIVSAVGDPRACTQYRSTYEALALTSLQNISTKIDTNYPNCKFKKLVNADSRNFISNANNFYSAAFQVHHTFQRICNKADFEYIGWAGFNSMFESDQFESDDTHLNTKGKAICGEWIKSAYFASAEYAAKIYAGGQVDFNYSTGSKATISVELLPDRADLYIRTFDIAAGAVNLAANAILLNSGTWDLPLPCPIINGGSIELHGNMEDYADGTALKHFIMNLHEYSGSGCLAVKTVLAISDTTTHKYGVFPQLTHISYVPC